MYKIGKEFNVKQKKQREITARREEKQRAIAAKRAIRAMKKKITDPNSDKSRQIFKNFFANFYDIDEEYLIFHELSDKYPFMVCPLFAYMSSIGRSDIKGIPNLELIVHELQGMMDSKWNVYYDSSPTNHEWRTKHYFAIKEIV